MATPEMLALGRNLPITVQRLTQEDSNRYSAKIAGYVHMRYLVIGDLQNVNLEVGELLLIRMLSEGEAVAYQVTVKKANSNPVLFMTTFPEKVESVNLRSSERIKAFFPAEVRHTSETAFKNFDSMVVDISEGGCSFSSKTAIREKNPVLIVFSLPGSQSVIRLSGTIVSVTARNSIFSHRFKFDDTGENEAGRAAIGKWVGEVSIYALD